ncbi:tRNA (guanine37-N1)-methyltransferase [Methanophagales archaeon]|nr:tRNA (guanine37-N1)-methyltransferase [Methanophagales archaeon]
MRTENLHCVKVEKGRGEQVRRALKELKLLRTDAKITSKSDCIYLPLIRALKAAESEVVGVTEFLTADFTILEPRRSIEDILGFSPAYEIIGDIAVLTGSQDTIAETNELQVAHTILDLHKNIKVVAKRISAVEGVYRNRKLKILAGENRTETIHKENGCRYKLDPEKVYFNPSLAGERNRVAMQVEPSKTEQIIDMFAGVGSFAIQIAKRAPQSHVTAIDINPDAIRYLHENMGLNGVRNIEPIEGDVSGIYLKCENKANRIIMNLPKSAYMFLREALYMLHPKGGMIHFYTVEEFYPAKGGKSKSLDMALEITKAKVTAKLKEHCDEFHYQTLELQEVRKVKPYAPYAYIIGVDAAIY